MPFFVPPPLRNLMLFLAVLSPPCNDISCAGMFCLVRYVFHSCTTAVLLANVRLLFAASIPTLLPQVATAIWCAVAVFIAHHTGTDAIVFFLWLEQAGKYCCGTLFVYSCRCICMCGTGLAPDTGVLFSPFLLLYMYVLFVQFIAATVRAGILFCAFFVLPTTL
ncbi:hypothetical protein AVEN_74243-1 [Araneus ventricosus]|uniref:Uncharacterized protein n=1 Tax=Araneus ventricosus TaxID=182803 RepID=A0A4Y2ERT1_ARAVE|nr:hypothetical protein AVEN_74243-1 [Araneus ventricosus]